MSLYRGFDQAGLDAAYNNRAAAKDFAGSVAGWQERSRTLPLTPADQLDIAYGPGPRQRIDWLAGSIGAPTLIFLHGGYWQAMNKEDHRFLAAGTRPRGWHLALIEYTLAPEADMAAIVAEAVAASCFLLDHAAAWGADPDRMILSGHSAGGHLAACVLGDTACATRFAGGLAISGLFDLEPIRLSYLNAALRLTPDQVRRFSPQHRMPAGGSPLAIAVGGDELPELRRQSHDHAETRRIAGLPGDMIELAGMDHFEILDALAAPDGQLWPCLERLVHP